jgi:large repetitive protein
MKTLAGSLALLSSFALVAIGCGQDQTDGLTSTDDALLTCDGWHHGDPTRHRGHHHGNHHHRGHLGGSGGSTGTGGTSGTGGQPHLTGSAGTTGMAGSTGTGGSGGAMVDPRCTPLDGMVSWWHGDGDFDDAVGSNDGTTGGGAAFGPGVENQGFSLSGQNGSFVLVPDDPSLSMTSAITIDTWINATVLSGNVISKATPNDGYMLDIQADRIRFFIATDAVMSEQIPVGMWIHVAGVFDGNNAGVYINGALSTEQLTNGHALIPNNQPLHIGADFQGQGQFMGTIDEPRVWNRALTADEIARLFWQGTNCH